MKADHCLTQKDYEIGPKGDCLDRGDDERPLQEASVFLQTLEVALLPGAGVDNHAGAKRVIQRRRHGPITDQSLAET